MTDVTTTQHVLRRDGCPFHYWLSGPENSPLVAFTHGGTLDHRMFDPQVMAVAQHYRVLTWDVRGHGLSQPPGKDFSLRIVAQDLIAILDSLRHRQAVFVGHCMGAYVVQELAFLHPERVTALVIIGGVCITLKRSALEMLSLKLSSIIGSLLPANAVSKYIAFLGHANPDLRSYIYEAGKNVSKATMRAIFQTVADCFHHEPDYRITHPLLLVHGERESKSIKREAPIWAAREPSCRYVMVPEAGHFTNQDNPGFFNNLLLDFLHETT